VLTLKIPPLSNADGAQYLRNLQVVAGAPILERLSHALGGNPTDIFAFAQSIPGSKRSEPEFIERISFAMAMGRLDEEDKNTGFFHDYVKKYSMSNPIKEFYYLFSLRFARAYFLRLATGFCRQSLMRPAYGRTFWGHLRRYPHRC
jgi:hypothetical protein